MSGQTEARRRYEREYARRKRAKVLDEQLRTATRCPKKFGRHVCNGRLRVDVDKATGRTIVVCELCERTARRICLECSSPVTGTSKLSRRCARHRELAIEASQRRSEARHHEKRLEAARRAYHENAEVRERRNAYKRLWRKENPDKIRAQKRRAALKQPKHVYRYMARYRKKHREHYREQARLRYYQEHPRRPAPKCQKCGKATRWKPLPGGRAGRPWLTCNACVPPCIRKQRLTARRRQLRQLRELEAMRPKKRKLVIPQGRKVSPTGERLCVGTGCHAVVRGRRKKCDACKARDREVAAQLLASHRGRGRRTDLERERAA